MSIKANRVGETRTMTNGMRATIVEYRNSIDMDIEFEDGTTRQHVRYNHFLSGKVSPIDIVKRAQNDRNKRIGETKMMNCGFSCVIVDYNNAHDITVEFEDGTRLTKKYYRDFIHGVIQYPTIYKKELNKDGKSIFINAQERIHETRQMLCGMKGTIIAYRSASDIDVQFEDGEVRYNVEYRSFRDGSLQHPGQLPKNQAAARVGEIKKMNNGLFAKIIAYRSWHDVDIEFDDGIIVQKQRYEKFKNGEIPHPNIKYKTAMSLQEFAIHYYLRNLGFRKVKQGEWEERGFGRFELDFYHEETKIAIEYDGGVHNKSGNPERDIRKNKQCKQLGIQLYRLRDPLCKPLNDDGSINYTLDKQKQIRLGLIDCKQELQSILHTNNLYVEPNYIDFDRDKDNIIEEYNNTYINYYSKERVGQKIYSKSAKQNITIIRYHSASDIDVQFESGEIRHGVSYTSFKRGHISLPGKGRTELKKARLGEQKLMDNGMLAKIITYNSSSDIDVQFEDGTIVYHKRYARFIAGQIGYPKQ